MKALGLVLVTALAGTAAAATGYWNHRNPNLNAERAVRLFNQVCVANLGKAASMHMAVRRSGAGFRRDFAGNRQWGPVWSSPVARIVASDHGHNHDGDECQLDLRRTVAPNADTTIAAMRKQGLAYGEGRPSELGATMFRQGRYMIFVRYTAPDERSGVTQEASGLMLLIKRPPG